MLPARSAPPRGQQRLHSRWHVLVMAKSPVPGRAKTRLCPPLTPHEAAMVAEAALADTLDAVAGCAAGRRILAIDSGPREWIPAGFEVIRQRGRTFQERLAAAWHDAGGPGLQIGMDTPQITAELLDSCIEAASRRAVTAALGAASDGGWWALALSQRWDRDLFRGVPMSTPHTGAAQYLSLVECGHRITRLPVLRDVDLIDDAFAVAELAPESRFARTLHGLEPIAC